MEFDSRLLDVLVVILVLAVYYLFPTTKYYSWIRFRIKPYLILFQSYLFFLVPEIPSIVQIIGIPSILGRVAEFTNSESTLLSFFVGTIAMFYLRFKNNDYLGKNKNFYSRTKLERKTAKQLWETFLYSTSLTCVFITYWVVSLLRS
jgi:hypothetical protein